MHGFTSKEAAVTGAAVYTCVEDVYNTSPPIASWWSTLNAQA
jgi:hypothetical protein